jgi:hypothetical protein
MFFTLPVDKGLDTDGANTQGNQTLCGLLEKAVMTAKPQKLFRKALAGQ